MADPWEELATKYSGGPDQTQQPDAWDALRAKYSAAPEQPAQQQQTPIPARQDDILDSVRKISAGILEPAYTVVTGAIAQPIGNIIGAGREILTGDFGKGTAERTAKAVQEALTYKPRTIEGKDNLETVGKAFESSKLAGLPVVGNELPVVGRAIAQQRPLLSTVPSAVMQSPEVEVLKKAVSAITPKPQTINADMYRTLKEGNQLGLVVPPSTVKPTFANRTMESVAGKIATQQVASNRNQPMIDAAIRAEFGLSEDSPITSAVMQQVRKAEYDKGYMPLESLGNIETDARYVSDLNAITKGQKGAARSFGAAVKDEVSPAIDPLKTVKSFDSSDAVKMVQILRDKAGEAYNNGQNALGAANKAAAKAIEGQIERYLSGMGKEGEKLLQQFRESRIQMAKTHTVEDAIREGSGTVDPKVFGKAIQNGDPLSGNLEKIGRWANTFEKSVQRPGQVGSPAVHNLMAVLSAMGGGGGAVVGGPYGAVAGAAAPLVVPPVVRNYLLSQGAQSSLLKQVAPKLKPPYAPTPVTVPTTPGLLSPAEQAFFDQMRMQAGLLQGDTNSKQGLLY